MESHNNHDAHSNGRPVDFAFRYEYNSSGAPPDDYYEFVIEIAPDGSGEIRFRRDYEKNHPDEFVAIFDPADVNLEKVYRLMLTGGICQPVWQPPRKKMAPGSSASRLEVTCGGNFFEVTPARFESLNEVGGVLHEAIRALVPQDMWAKIDKFDYS